MDSPGRLARRAALLFCAATLWAQAPDLVRQSQLGRQLMEQGRFAEAIPVYEGLVKALPDNTGLRLNLGLAQQMAGHTREAIAQFEGVLKAEPGNVPALMSLAASHLELNEPRAAIDPLKKVLAGNPQNLEARGMLASALLDVGHAGEAAGQYQKLTVLAPGDPKAWFGLGKAYEAQAAAAFEKLAKIAPESGYMAALLADSRVQQRQYRSAFYFYKQAEAKLPSLAGVHAGMAEVYRKTGHPDWAAKEEERERAVAARPTGPAAPNTPAALFRSAKESNRLAVEAFEKLGALPESVELHAVKAQILASHNQHLEGAEEWRAALKLAPGDPKLERELTSALFLARDFEHAMPLLEQQLRAEPGSAELNFMMGESLLRSEQAEKAVPYLEAALRADPGMTAAHGSLGLALMQVNQAAKAIPHLKQAIDLDDDGSLHYQLARAYQAAGESEQARATMAQYQQIVRKNEQGKAELAKEVQITAP